MRAIGRCMRRLAPLILRRAPCRSSPRHSMLATITYAIKAALELTAIARAVSGSYFSPLVGGDINGDGRMNDRAFVFNPADAAARGDTAVADGMTRLLANTSTRAR